MQKLNQTWREIFLANTNKDKEKKGHEVEQKLNSPGYNRVLRYKVTCSERCHIEANQVILKDTGTAWKTVSQVFAFSIFKLSL